jgi:hypothetical protein
VNLEVERFEGELRWLRWFYEHADFGPADSDVRQQLHGDYIRAGNRSPRGYAPPDETARVFYEDPGRAFGFGDDSGSEEYR